MLADRLPPGPTRPRPDRMFRGMPPPTPTHVPGLRHALYAALALAAVALGSTARAGDEPDGAALRRSPVVRAVEKARRAVVPIHTTRIIHRAWFPAAVDLPQEGKGVGSGVIFHPGGYVITNAHVVARASEIFVDVLRDDGTADTHEAHIFAVDLANDLAIVKLAPEGGGPYPHLGIGTSDDLMLGETVIAIGNPFGIGLTVTTGVIGGLGRRLEVGDASRVFDDFVQVDAAVNPGNSGGALLDVTGRWIGVTTAIVNHQSGAEGIGFAIPAKRIRTLVARAFKRRLLQGDWLGIELESGPGEAARVANVFPGGPAALAGVERGDVMTSLDGQPTPTLFDLRWRMSFVPRGAPLRLGIQRDGRTLPDAITVRLVPLPTDDLSRARLGFTAKDVGEKENLERQIAFDAGVMVDEVRAGGPADRIGLRSGDLVVGLGNYRIRHSDDLLLFLQYVQAGDVVQVKAIRFVDLPNGRAFRQGREGRLIAE